MRRITLAALCALLLTGCVPGPDKMGVSQQQWHRAGASQHKAWRKAYQRYHQLHPQLLGDAQADQMVVRIAGGKALFPPNFSIAMAYQPIHVDLNDGACQTVAVNAQKSNQHASLYLCFAKHTVALDPSRLDAASSNGSLIFNGNPLWLRPRGLLYRSVNSHGLVAFQHVNVRLTLNKVIQA